MTTTPLTINGRNLLTNSALSTFRTCKRKYQLSYEFGLRPNKDSLALSIGSYMHRALELFLKGTNAETALAEALKGEPVTYDIAAMQATLLGYWHHWAQPHHPTDVVISEVLAVEQSFRMPLVNPHSGRKSRQFVMAGKIDGIVKLGDGQIAVLEHKSTSEDISPGSDYWARLRMDSQINTYLAAARSLGYNATTVLYDVIVKTSKRPAMATPLDKRKYKADGTLYAAQREFDETIEAWQARIADDVIAAPTEFYARKQVGRLSADAGEFAEELWDQAEDIKNARKIGSFYKNTGACTHYGKCQYFEVCANNMSIEAAKYAGFKIVDNVHQELA